MSNSKGSTSTGCSSLLILLFLVFVVLKLTGAIQWDWIYVFVPLIVFAFYVVAGALVLAVATTVAGVIIAIMGDRHG